MEPKYSVARLRSSSFGEASASALRGDISPKQERYFDLVMVEHSLLRRRMKKSLRRQNGGVKLTAISHA